MALLCLLLLLLLLPLEAAAVPLSFTPPLQTYEQQRYRELHLYQQNDFANTTTTSSKCYPLLQQQPPPLQQPPPCTQVPGCWANPNQGVLRILLMQNASAALLAYNITNSSNIGALTCTSRCSVRCPPGEFIFAPCTPLHDVQCAVSAAAAASSGSSTRIPVVNRLSNSTTAPPSASSARWPAAVVSNTSSRVYYVEGHAIFYTDGRFDHVAFGSAELFAGSPSDAGFVDHPAIGGEARFNNPGGLAILYSPAGEATDIYVADTDNAAVRRVSLLLPGAAGAAVSTVFGGPANILMGAAVTVLLRPLDLSWGPDSMLYVIDPGNYVIFRYCVLNTFVSTLRIDTVCFQC